MSYAGLGQQQGLFIHEQNSELNIARDIGAKGVVNHGFTKAKREELLRALPDSANNEWCRDFCFCYRAD